MNKHDAYLFRRYITEGEYSSKSLELANEKISYLEEEKLILISQKNNAIAKQTAAENLLNDIQRISSAKDKEWEKLVENTKKESTKKGILKGTVVGVVLTTILCLLVK